MKRSRGETLVLPNLGMETVHHVHADDVVQGFVQALAHHSAAVGESFHVVSSAALTLRGYADATWDHIAHSPCCSIAKAQRLLNYQPRYSSLEAIRESVAWLIEHRAIAVS